MPYVSHQQRKYFNANREKLEAEGVDVDEWNDSSRGKKLPKRAKKPNIKEELSMANKTARYRLGEKLSQSAVTGLRMGQEGLRDAKRIADAAEGAGKSLSTLTNKAQGTLGQADKTLKAFQSAPITVPALLAGIPTAGYLAHQYLKGNYDKEKKRQPSYKYAAKTATHRLGEKLASLPGVSMPAVKMPTPPALNGAGAGGAKPTPPVAASKLAPVQPPAAPAPTALPKAPVAATKPKMSPDPTPAPAPYEQRPEALPRAHSGQQRVDGAAYGTNVQQGMREFGPGQLPPSVIPPNMGPAPPGPAVAQRPRRMSLQGPVRATKPGPVRATKPQGTIPTPVQGPVRATKPGPVRATKPQGTIPTPVLPTPVVKSQPSVPSLPAKHKPRQPRRPGIGPGEDDHDPETWAKALAQHNATQRAVGAPVTDGTGKRPKYYKDKKTGLVTKIDYSKGKEPTQDELEANWAAGIGAKGKNDLAKSNTKTYNSMGRTGAPGLSKGLQGQVDKNRATWDSAGGDMGGAGTMTSRRANRMNQVTQSQNAKKEQEQAELVQRRADNKGGSGLTTFIANARAGGRSISQGAADKALRLGISTEGMTIRKSLPKKQPLTTEAQRNTADQKRNAGIARRKRRYSHWKMGSARMPRLFEVGHMLFTKESLDPRLSDALLGAGVGAGIGGLSAVPGMMTKDEDDPERPSALKRMLVGGALGGAAGPALGLGANKLHQHFGQKDTDSGVAEASGSLQDQVGEHVDVESSGSLDPSNFSLYDYGKSMMGRELPPIGRSAHTTLTQNRPGHAFVDRNAMRNNPRDPKSWFPESLEYDTELEPYEKSFAYLLGESLVKTADKDQPVGAPLGSMQHANVADAVGADSSARAYAQTKDHPESEDGMFNEFMASHAGGMEPFHRRMRHGNSRLAESRGGRMVNRLDPTQLYTKNPDYTLTNLLMGTGKKDPEREDLVKQRYKEVLKPHQDTLDESVETTERDTPWHRIQQGHLANQDSDIAGHKYMRDKKPGQYWLNPFDRSGPLAEVWDRLRRRNTAGRAYPDSTLGRFGMELGNVGTLGLLPTITGGEKAQQSLRGSAAKNKVYSDVADPERKSKKKPQSKSESKSEKESNMKTSVALTKMAHYLNYLAAKTSRKAPLHIKQAHVNQLTKLSRALYAKQNLHEAIKVAYPRHTESQRFKLAHMLIGGLARKMRKAATTGLGMTSMPGGAGGGGGTGDLSGGGVVGAAAGGVNGAGSNSFSSNVAVA